jgi:hypothetical protein
LPATPCNGSSTVISRTPMTPLEPVVRRDPARSV